MVKDSLKEISKILQEKYRHARGRLVLRFTAVGGLLLKWNNKQTYTEDDFFRLVTVFVSSPALVQVWFKSYLSSKDARNFNQLITTCAALAQQRLLTQAVFHVIINAHQRQDYIPLLKVLMGCNQRGISAHLDPIMIHAIQKKLKHRCNIEQIIAAFWQLKRAGIRFSPAIVVAMGDCMNLSDFASALIYLNQYRLLNQNTIESLKIAAQPIFLGRILVFLHQGEIPVEAVIDDILTKDLCILSQVITKISYHLSIHDYAFYELFKAIMRLSPIALRNLSADMDTIKLGDNYLRVLYDMLNSVKSTPQISQVIQSYLLTEVQSAPEHHFSC